MFFLINRLIINVTIAKLRCYSWTTGSDLYLKVAGSTFRWYNLVVWTRISPINFGKKHMLELELIQETSTIKFCMTLDKPNAFTLTTNKGYVDTVAPSFAKAPSKKICASKCNEF